jgi:cytochrome c-type biogenesis protein CcmE
VTEEKESAHAEEVPSNPGVEVPGRRRGRKGPEEEDGNRRRNLVLTILLVMVGAGAASFVLMGMKDQAIYSKPVDELVANKSRFAGREVMAEGNLVHGSLTKRDQPCEYRFTIQAKGTEVPVRFPQCVVPDTFRDVPGMDVGVTVKGELLADNTFLANQVLAKCPSKYEMKDRAQKGEKMPHAEIEPTTGL